MVVLDVATKKEKLGQLVVLVLKVPTERKKPG
jgi:hypothetical protein